MVIAEANGAEWGECKIGADNNIGGDIIALQVKSNNEQILVAARIGFDVQYKILNELAQHQPKHSCKKANEHYEYNEPQSF